MAEPTILRLVREVIEPELGGNATATTVVHALGSWDAPVPVELRDALRFLRGPMREALLTRLSPAAVSPLLSRIEQEILDADFPTSKREAPASVRPAGGFSDDDRRTVSIPEIGDAVRITVLSAGGGCAKHLIAAVGGPTLDLRTASSLDDIHDDVHVVIVDSGLPPEIDAGDLAGALAALDARCWRIVWGSDLSVGRRIVELLERDGVHVVSLPVRAGLGPLEDLVLARMGGATEIEIELDF